MSTCCCCPMNTVDWHRKGGLINFNLPCCPISKPVEGYTIDDSTGEIIIPNIGVVVPSFLCCFPIFWIHAAIMFPLSQMNVFILTPVDSRLQLESRTKFFCGEVTNFKRNAVLSAECEVKPAGWLTSESYRLAIRSDHGVDETMWVMNCKANVQALARAITTSVEQLQQRNLIVTTAPISNMDFYPSLHSSMALATAVPMQQYPSIQPSYTQIQPISQPQPQFAWQNNNPNLMQVAPQPTPYYVPQQQFPVGGLPNQAVPQVLPSVIAQDTRLMNVVVPEKAFAGCILTVTGPDGRQLQVTVPPGKSAGESFSVSY